MTYIPKLAKHRRMLAADREMIARDLRRAYVGLKAAERTRGIGARDQTPWCCRRRRPNRSLLAE